jgi:hypothetical protein
VIGVADGNRRGKGWQRTEVPTPGHEMVVEQDDRYFALPSSICQFEHGSGRGTCRTHLDDGVLLLLGRRRGAAVVLLVPGGSSTGSGRPILLPVPGFLCCADAGDYDGCRCPVLVCNIGRVCHSELGECAHGDTCSRLPFFGSR